MLSIYHYVVDNECVCGSHVAWWDYDVRANTKRQTLHLRGGIAQEILPFTVLVLSE